MERLMETEELEVIQELEPSQLVATAVMQRQAEGEMEETEETEETEVLAKIIVMGIPEMLLEEEEEDLEQLLDL